MMLAFALVLALVSPLSGSATAPAAASAVVYPSGTHPVIRMNVAGKYAAVLLKGGLMEGTPVTNPILVEHFAFGWQALDLLNFSCRLNGHGLSASDRAILMRGMPAMQADQQPCQDQRDAGPLADVNAVRLLQNPALIPRVAVAGSYAKGEWYGGGGGENYWHKEGSTWHKIAGGGGAMSSVEVLKLGVPASALCTLQVYDATCSKR